MSPDAERAAALYLALLRGCLTRSTFPERYAPHRPRRRVRRWLARLATIGASRDLEIVQRLRVDAARRAVGRDWPTEAETMIGETRLAHLQGLVEDVVRRDVPGDLLETGVWRGGAVILMRAALEAFGDRTRTVWAADSFQGLPPPDPVRHPADAGSTLHEQSVLAVSLAEVKRNFARYGLLDERVRFLVGWFEDTLPTAPVERLSILRLDGDLHASTKQALDALYPKVSIGGHVVVDDYQVIEGCRQAVDEYRAAHGSTEPLERIDGDAVCWRRAR